MKRMAITLFQAAILALLMVIGAYASNESPKGCSTAKIETQCVL